MGRGAWRLRHRHRRQRARLLRAIPTAGPSTCVPSRRWRIWRPRPASKGSRFHIHAPLLAMTKAEIIRRGLELGVDYAPHAQLLRSRFIRAGRAATATVACSGPGLRRSRRRRPGAGVEQPDQPTINPTQPDRNPTNRGDPPLLHRQPSHHLRRARHRVRRWNGRPFVVLDRTAFYPTTGGQPHDTGTLGDRQRGGCHRPRGRRGRAARAGRAARRRRAGVGGRSTGRGGWITCSSTPGSTCCRRRSCGCSRSRRSAFTWALTCRRSIWPGAWA